jgi:hypothetical protein
MTAEPCVKIIRFVEHQIANRTRCRPIDTSEFLRIPPLRGDTLIPSARLIEVADRTEFGPRFGLDR